MQTNFALHDVPLSEPRGISQSLRELRQGTLVSRHQRRLAAVCAVIDRVATATVDLNAMQSGCWSGVGHGPVLPVDGSPRASARCPPL